jgi:hypothetical protein
MIDQSKINKPTPSNLKNNKPNDCMAGLTNRRKERGYINITDMIRSLQRTEGLNDCFRRSMADCDQLECAWRQYCLKNTDGLPPLK